MPEQLVDIITASDPQQRNQPLEALCRILPMQGLLGECRDLDVFRRRSDNLYERVRALFFLHAIHRFHLPAKPEMPRAGQIPYQGFCLLLERRFEEALNSFLDAQERSGPSETISSALAAGYHSLAFQTLADQVRHSVRSQRGNQWMFRVEHPMDHPLRIHPALLKREPATETYPLLQERTPVRMDLSHSGWSDIFFLGMDYPEGARVLNVSIDLGVLGRDSRPEPPIETLLRVIDEPVLRLTSVDLQDSADVAELTEVFDFARDHLGLLKAGIIAAGVVPPGVEGCGHSLRDLLERLVGPGLGLEVVTRVNDIPKGSRLAVSTNLLASLISVCMRATGQTQLLVGPLREEERRVVAARAILGEWLGGSGGGWQDSGGLWPGIKLIQGVTAQAGDPEFGISRGRLLPQHRILSGRDAPELLRERLHQSLVLVHGGMAQNVGPVLEMVTEKYLLRLQAEWQARGQMREIFDDILGALRRSDVSAIGQSTTRNFMEPLQTIIPAATNLYTESLIERVRARFAERFWGFWMLGGMSGGGMGFIFHPDHRESGRTALREIMQQTKDEMQHALPFAMNPVVYDFAINDVGSHAELLQGKAALLPPAYYTLKLPALLHSNPSGLSPDRRRELAAFSTACRESPEYRGCIEASFETLFPPSSEQDTSRSGIENLLEEQGFDRTQHEQIRADLRSGRIGLAQNRLPSSSVIDDVRAEDVLDVSSQVTDADRAAGRRALADGSVAVVTLAAGLGSRWTQGAGVVKALNPFCKLAGRHRSFIEIHLAKSRRTSLEYAVAVPHIFTTSYLTHAPIREHLEICENYGYTGPVFLSPGRAVGLRLIPMERDLRFAWEELPQQLLDERAQKMRDSLHLALIGWARSCGEGNDYTDNVPLQCLHPVGHWFEPPNLLRNGVLASLISERPAVKTLLMHNIDTLGANLDPGVLGLFLRQRSCLAFEVIARRIEDHGGGLARVNGAPRLVEGLAMPREEDEFNLSYYNSMTTWIDVDRLLDAFGLRRADLENTAKVAEAVRIMAARMPTYVTLKDVKKRWGHGQEDIFPVTQFEKLWGDMTALQNVDSRFFVAARHRGQQLKDPAQLDGWLRDGSAEKVASLCAW
jgi:hypothetical protein